MTLRYIIANRIRPKKFSHAWFKAWGKRFFTMHHLLVMLLRGWDWRRRGVKMGDCAGIGDCELQGNHRNFIVGSFSTVGCAYIQLLAPVTIGDNVVINDKVIILTGSHDVNDEFMQLQTKPVTIGNYAWICTGATILPGITVGDGGVVAAGAVVTRDVAAYTVVAGNPAKVVRENRSRKLDYKPNLLRACYEAWVGVPYSRK